MPEDEEYQYISKSKLADMERELEILKKSKTGQTTSGELQVSIEKLSKSVEQMMKIFKLATDEIKLEEHDDDTVSKRLEPIMGKLNELTQQNEKIADGVVAVADMLKDHMDKEMSEFKTVESRIGQISMPPPMPSSPRAPSFSDMPEFGSDMFGAGQMPPPSPGFGMPPAPGPQPNMSFGMDSLGAKPEKKKGFLSFGK